MKIALFIHVMGMSKSKIYWVLQLTLILLVFSQPLAALSLKEPVLECDEFRGILHFIKREHIRFEYINSVQKRKIMAQAYEHLGESILLY